jgi:signal transduction histidine kinase
VTSAVSAESEEERILILAPIGHDAELAAAFLRRAGFRSEAFKTLTALCASLSRPAGVLLIAEEALTPQNAPELKAQLSMQAPWSDLPIILLTAGREKVFSSDRILDFFSPGGNISILERPFYLLTLKSAVQVALRSRRRQYQVRDLIKSQQVALSKRDEFLSVASHELKTPITSLKIQVQTRKRFLQKGDLSAFDPEKVTSLIETADRQLKRLSRLVDDMLDISRIVNGKLALNQSEVELGGAVREVLETLSAQLKDEGCELDFQVESEAFGYWDRYRIEQVITNIFSNALKYGSGRPIQVRVRNENGSAVLVVKDQGIGIAPENQERIFQRFERAIGSESISGLGLGLYIARQIVELHGGTIEVQSSLGQGATFIVHLPAMQTKRMAYASN